VMEFEGEGEANDAGPRDADVMIRRRGMMHGISLVGIKVGVPSHWTKEQRRKTGPSPSTNSGSG
jgi:hypothetical protein